MQLRNVSDWLKTLPVKANNYYVGVLDGKKEKSFGTYQLKSRKGREIALGGDATTKIKSKDVSILIHWNKNSIETEETSFLLYEAICNAEDTVIGGFIVNYIQLHQNEPIDAGQDESGIFERVIEMTIYYEKGLD